MLTGIAPNGLKKCAGPVLPRLPVLVGVSRLGRLPPAGHGNPLLPPACHIATPPCAADSVVEPGAGCGVRTSAVRCDASVDTTATTPNWDAARSRFAPHLTMGSREALLGLSVAALLVGCQTVNVPIRAEDPEGHHLAGLTGRLQVTGGCLTVGEETARSSPGRRGPRGPTSRRPSTSMASPPGSEM
jgi:hypothetical protein